MQASTWLDAFRRRPRKEPPRCHCCGRCCEAFGGHLHASRADVERWRRLGRDDLLERVSSVNWIWMNPETGKLEDRCPFLVRTGPETAACSIQDVKPDMCRDYPTIAHGKRCLSGVFLRGMALASGGVELVEQLLVAVA